MKINVVVSTKELGEMGMTNMQLLRSLVIALEKRAIDHHKGKLNYSFFDVTVTVDDAEPVGLPAL